MDATIKAGELIENLGSIWHEATLDEKHKLLTIMLDAVYIDTKDNLVIAVKPKPPFKPVFQVAALREKSAIHILN
jgi:site-specific DNA recombinase